MNKRFLFLTILLITGLGLISYKITHAFFSDTGSSTVNIFAASEVFPTATPSATPIPELVLNEVSSDGNPNLEWVEIHNPTGSSVDVSGWTIEDALTDDVFPTVSPIPAGGYAVVIGNASTVSVPSSAITITLGNSTIGSGLNDTGDLIRLKTPATTIVDEMSYGNNTTVFPTPPVAPDAGESVARNPNGVDTNTAGDWVIDSSPSIGVAN